MDKLNLEVNLFKSKTSEVNWFKKRTRPSICCQQQLRGEANCDYHLLFLHRERKVQMVNWLEKCKLNWLDKSSVMQSACKKSFRNFGEIIWTQLCLRSEQTKFAKQWSSKKWWIRSSHKICSNTYCFQDPSSSQNPSKILPKCSRDPPKSFQNPSKIDVRCHQRLLGNNFGPLIGKSLILHVKKITQRRPGMSRGS